MKPLTEQDIRSSFVNCSKGDAKRMGLPANLAERPWEDMDFLGWSDPTFAGRSYIVVPREDELVGVALRHGTGSDRTQMCTICMTTHTRGYIALMTAKKVGESGRRGNTVGTYMCVDLDCSLYARGKKTPALGSRYRENLSEEERITRVQDNLGAFVARLYT